MEDVAALKSFKLPPFWANNIALWFTRIEAQFTRHNIQTQKAKFNALICEMEEKVMMEVSDIITNPTEGEEYTKLKEAITTRFHGSEERRIMLVLNSMQLEDSKPSQLYRKMETSAGTALNEKTLKTVWMQRLPNSIQSILAGSDQALDIKTLIEMADRIYAFHQPGTSVSAVQSTSQATEDPIAKLIARIDALESKLTQQHRGRSSSRGNGGGNRQRSASHGGLCYYHHKFKTKAQKCSKPCTWVNRQPSENGSSQN